MQISALAAAAIALSRAIDVLPGVRVSVEIVAGDVVIRIAQGTERGSADQGTSAASPMATPAALAESPVEPMPVTPAVPKTGRDVAEHIAAVRGAEALLKFSEWDEELPPSVVRRQLISALRDGRLPSTLKRKTRAGRARLISARAMADFLAKLEEEKR